MRASNNLENKTLSDKSYRVQLVCIKVQAHSSLQPSLESGPDAFHESRLTMTFLTILGVMEILHSYRLVLEGKTVKEISESSRSEFLVKFLANNITLSDAEDKTPVC